MSGVSSHGAKSESGLGSWALVSRINSFAEWHLRKGLTMPAPTGMDWRTGTNRPELVRNISGFVLWLLISSHATLQMLMSGRS
jgi:hypothetical protein